MSDLMKNEAYETTWTTIKSKTGFHGGAFKQRPVDDEDS
jgi:hypothetical protein